MKFIAETSEGKDFRIITQAETDEEAVANLKQLCRAKNKHFVAAHRFLTFRNKMGFSIATERVYLGYEAYEYDWR